MKTLEWLLLKEDLLSFLQLQMEFLREHEWIFNFKVTHILVDGVKDRIPPDWLSFLSTTSLTQFNNLLLKSFKRINNTHESSSCIEAKDNLPQCVLKFFESLEFLKIDYRKHPRSSATIAQDLRKGMSPKKHHEVVQFSDLILEKCARENLSSVVDIGSGVGYLGSVLTRAGVSVVGVEGCEGHANKAETRRAKNKNNFPTVNVKVDSGDECARILSSHCPEDVALIGLHCCGDLSPDLIQLFGKIVHAKCLLLVSCCYHKMERSGEGFRNFPLSSGLKDIISEDLKLKELVDVPTLRLGAQETVARWNAMSEDDHEQHMRNVGYRAVLEAFADSMGVRLVKKGRRGVKQKGFQDFESFLKAVPQTYELDDRALENIDLMRDLHEEHTVEFRIFELLTGLQFLVQSVIENLVLLDRIQYVRESLGDSVNVEVLEVFDDDLSPRNKVMLVTKC